MNRLPMLTAEFHGHDDDCPVYLVTVDYQNGKPDASTFIHADNADDALCLAACEWQIEDYAFRKTA